LTDDSFDIINKWAKERRLQQLDQEIETLLEQQWQWDVLSFRATKQRTEQDINIILSPQNGLDSPTHWKNGGLKLKWRCFESPTNLLANWLDSFMFACGIVLE
jgi:HPt (histidine-containing phosphotransfer) domain-containing protein